MNKKMKPISLIYGIKFNSESRDNGKGIAPTVPWDKSGWRLNSGLLSDNKMKTNCLTKEQCEICKDCDDDKGCGKDFDFNGIFVICGKRKPLDYGGSEIYFCEKCKSPNDGADDSIIPKADETTPEGDQKDKLLESAWGLIANSYEGDWDKAPKSTGWKKAAEKWRDKYHNAPEGDAEDVLISYKGGVIAGKKQMLSKVNKIIDAHYISWADCYFNNTSKEDLKKEIKEAGEKDGK